VLLQRTGTPDLPLQFRCSVGGRDGEHSITVSVHRRLTRLGLTVLALFPILLILGFFMRRCKLTT
jgi:hypothetical protein